ncbi:MAG: FAD-dependent oxidoreductase, partial [Actinomycetota bacterium]
MTKKHKKKKDKKKKQDAAKTTEVVIVGAGFAGIGCAKELAKRHDVHVTLLDKHNYHQFLPLLY